MRRLVISRHRWLSLDPLSGPYQSLAHRPTPYRKRPIVEVQPRAGSRLGHIGFILRQITEQDRQAQRFVPGVVSDPSPPPLSPSRSLRGSRRASPGPPK